MFTARNVRVIIRPDAGVAKVGLEMLKIGVLKEVSGTNRSAATASTPVVHMKTHLRLASMQLDKA